MDRIAHNLSERESFINLRGLNWMVLYTPPTSGKPGSKVHSATALE